MARKLRLEIEGDSRDARKALDDVADEAEKTARSTEVLGSQFRKAAKDSEWLERNLKDASSQSKQTNTSIVGLGKSTEKTAEEFREAAAAAAKLDAQLVVTRSEITKLNKAYAEGGDATVLKNLQKQLGEQDRLVRLKTRLLRDEQEAAKKNDPLEAIEKQYAVIERTARLKRRIAKDEEDAHRENERRNAAAAAAAKLLQRNRRGVLRNTLGDLFGLGIGGVKAGASGLADATSKIPGGKLALGVVGAGAVPAAGALGGAALLGGAGLAGIGAGIAGAVANNPEPFRKAWTAAIADISRQWQQSSATFEKPTLEAIQILRNAVMDIDLAGPFKEASKWVIPLANGIGGLVKGIGEGVGILIKGSGPVLGVLAKDLPKIGLAFKQLSKDVAGSADGAGEALHDVLDFTGALVVGVGKGISALANFYRTGNKIYDSIIDANRKITGIKLFGGSEEPVMAFAKSLREVSTSAGSAADEVAKLNDAYQDIINQQFAAKDASIALAQGWIDLKKELADGKKTLDLNTQAGIDNQQAILEQIKNAERLRQETGQLDGSWAKANATYDASIERIRKMAYDLGFTKDQVDALILSVTGIPPVVTSEIKTPGMAEALAQGISLGNALNRIPGTYTANVRVNAPPGISLGNLTHHAGGGTMMESGPKLVGEQGPEIIWGSKGQFVNTSAETKRVLANQAVMANGGGGGVGSTTLVISASASASSFDNALLGWFADAVRSGRLAMLDSNNRRVKIA